jgi:hypothetical protein
VGTAGAARRGSSLVEHEDTKNDIMNFKYWKEKNYGSLGFSGARPFSSLRAA